MTEAVRAAWASAAAGEVQVRRGDYDKLGGLFEGPTPALVMESAMELAATFSQRILGGEPTAFKATVTTGKKMTQCPKLHADLVTVRCLVTLMGPGTVVVDRPFSLPSDDECPDSAFYNANPGDALLLKGRKTSNPARHRSPTLHHHHHHHHHDDGPCSCPDHKRVFLCLDLAVDAP